MKEVVKSAIDGDGSSDVSERMDLRLHGRAYKLIRRSSIGYVDSSSSVGSHQQAEKPLSRSLRLYWPNWSANREALAIKLDSYSEDHTTIYRLQNNPRPKKCQGHKGAEHPKRANPIRSVDICEPLGPFLKEFTDAEDLASSFSRTAACPCFKAYHPKLAQQAKCSKASILPAIRTSQLRNPCAVDLESSGSDTRIRMSRTSAPNG